MDTEMYADKMWRHKGCSLEEELGSEVESELSTRYFKAVAKLLVRFAIFASRKSSINFRLLSCCMATCDISGLQLLKTYCANSQVFYYQSIENSGTYLEVPNKCMMGHSL